MVAKAILVLPKRDFRGQTFLVLSGTLEESDVAVFVSSSTLEACVAEDGFVVKPDFRNIDVKGTEWDAIIFLDGLGSSEYWFDSTAHTLCQVAWSADRLVGAIGPAVLTVVNSGIAAGLRVASGKSLVDAVSAKDGIPSRRPVEVDGNLVTAIDDSAAEAFAAKVAELLTGQKRSKIAGAA